MNHAAGQAGRIAGWLLRLLGKVLLTVFAMVMLSFGALAYRLDQGPLQIPYVASRLATAVSGQGVTVHIDQAALTWGGYKKGGGAPLYLQLHGIRASNAKGAVLATVPQARLLFPVRALFGVSAPVDVTGSGGHIALSDAPVAVAALFRFGFGFALAGADMTVTLGAGTLGQPGESLAITGGAFVLHLKPQDAVLQAGRLNLVRIGESAPVVGFSGTAHRGALWQGSLRITADRVRAADLPAYWPPAVGANPRRWVAKNIVAGSASHADFTFTGTAPRDLSSFSITGIRGGYDATGITMHWLPGLTPVTALDGRLDVLDPDSLLITTASGRLGGLQVAAGTMKITGLSKPDQIATIKLRLDGMVPAAVAVLNAPPLALLARAPAELAKATGTMRADINATLPLEDKLKLAQVALAVVATFADVGAPTPLAGLTFTAGALTLRASQTQLSVAGTGQLAGEKLSLALRAVYAADPVLRHLEIATTLGPGLLNQYGLGAETTLADAVSGTAPAEIRLDAGPNGTQTATADADLTGAALGIPALGWAKQAGQPGALHAAAVLDQDGAIMVQNFTARGPALDIRGAVDGHRLHFAAIDIGRTAATGDVTYPGAPRTPWRIDLHGPSLDLRAIVNPPRGAAAGAARAAAKGPDAAAPGAATPSGPPWQASLNFTAVALAKPPAPGLRNLVFTGSGTGGTVLTAEASAEDQAGLPVTLTVAAAAAPGRRDLRLQAADGGTLLRTVGAYDDVQGGGLGLDAAYGAGAPFSGTVTLTKFQLLRAPALGKILQALTIYGVAEAASGPGLVFSRLIAPFSIAHQVLTLKDARAYSASLGFTASGTIGLQDGAADLDATVIPAYALNALPGKIPLIGKLFTAEKGGGLFAVRVKVSGSLDDPKLTANPFSALTPGVLRDVFGGARGK